MKQIVSVAVVLVLTASLLVGCGCRNSAPANTTAPTTMPTVNTTAPTTEMTTVPTTQPITEATDNATIEDGNGPISTDSSVAGDASRSRSSGMYGGAGTGNGITGSITG